MRFLLLLCLISMQSYAQLNLTDKSVAKAIEEAQLFYAAGDYLSCREELAHLLHGGRSIPEVCHLYGAASYRLLPHRKEAVRYLECAVNLGYEPAYSDYARLLLEFDRLDELAAFLKEHGELNIGGLNLVRNHLETAERLIANPVSSEVSELSGAINSKFSEHSPILIHHDSMLVFTSRRPMDGNSITDDLGRYDENIYVSYVQPGGWSPAVPLPGRLNGLLNEAAVAAIRDEELVFFKTSNDLESSDLFVAKYTESGEWKRVEKMHPSINSNEIESGLTASSNGDYFIVSSNRQGGYGGMDLYRVVRMADGSFSEPVNLGAEINTAFNEVSPFLMPDDQTFYFSSDRPESMGGYDIFRTTLVHGKSNGQIENLGYPINSTRDDLHLIVSTKTGKIFFTRSATDNPGNHEIFSGNLPGFDFRATVFRIKLIAPNGADFSNASARLLLDQTPEQVEVFRISPHGSFIVVLQPGQSGVLHVDVKGFESEQFEVNYMPSEAMLEIELRTKLKPREIE